MAEEKVTSNSKVEEVTANVKDSSVESSVSSSSDSLAIGSLILGVFSLCGSFCLGLCCSPFAIAGVVLGVLGLKSEKNKTMAIAGIVLSAIALVISIVMIFVGALINLSSLQK